MKYSVIVPIYNVEDYLPRCIDSIISQTFTDFELILVDDGSPDNCGKICDEYAKKDNRIRVIHKENGGLSSARNAGLDVAKGEYIYFIDSDDYIKENLLEHCLPYLEDGLDMVAFNYIQVNEKTKEERVSTYNPSLFEIHTPKERNRFIIDTLLPCRIGWEAWGRIFRRSIIEEKSLRFADNRKIFAEDLYFSLCYLAHATRIISISSPLYYYITRENSIMGKDSKKFNFNRMHLLANAVKEHWASQEDCSNLLEIFDFVYYEIIGIEIANTRRNFCLDMKTLRSIMKKELPQYDNFRNIIKTMVKRKKEMVELYGALVAANKLNWAKYIYDGNYLAFAVRSRLIYHFPIIMLKKYYELTSLDAELKALNKTKQRVFILGSEEFGNLGDHQIVFSTERFIEESLPDAAVFVVTHPKFPLFKPLLRMHIKKNDIIVFPGGGNVGDEYAQAEKMRCDIIRTWHKNPKIIFPQTIQYSKTAVGNDMLENAKKYYSKKNNLVFFARDKVSYDFAVENFSCDTFLIPDIVLTESKQTQSSRKKQILLCLRNDVEKNISAGEEKLLESLINDTDYTLTRTDLQLEYNVERTLQHIQLNKTFALWSESSLLITDRLHGMIFAAITGTPCIVLSNYNHKVKGAYDWISYLPYIKYANSVDEVSGYIPELLNMHDIVYDNSPLLPHFEKLKEKLHQLSKE